MSEGKRGPRRPPKVFVAPGCFGQITRVDFSPWAFLEPYLQHPGIRRTAPKKWDKRLPWDEYEKERETVFLQGEIDKALRRILNGESPSKVFSPRRKAVGSPGYGGKSVGYDRRVEQKDRNRAIACEVWRLTKQGYSRRRAEEAVADAYSGVHHGISHRTVQYITKNSRLFPPRGNKETPLERTRRLDRAERQLTQYQQHLRLHGKLA